MGLSKELGCTRVQPPQPRKFEDISLKQSAVADLNAARRQNLGLGGVGRDFNVLTS